ncbi:MAG: hypothetical protein K0Q72_2870 [Armatimonadetes bacterium]|jgi:hypothetical protein|nr:hypothetical protein [Armatimonadota bacterium]
MERATTRRCTAFAGERRIATGELLQVALATRAALEQGETAPVLIFDDVTSHRVEVDLRGTAEEVADRLQAAEPAAVAEPDAARGPGRPKLGVVAREVTLLPRHWEWLSEQPGGASVALRKLVEEARRTNEGRDRARRAQESAYRFMSVMAGNLPGFEEASRALFAGNIEGFKAVVEAWPEDIRAHLERLV